MGSLRELTGEVRESTRAVSQVNGIAVENKERIAGLMGEASRFTVE
ncbi:MAG: hypothetical protein LBK73_14745 [Treponema sp.]|nr:hypothetical protein [Treponema sp.]